MGLLSGRKGAVELSVTNRAYNPGEEIPMSVRLTTKKDLGPGRLFVALVMTETVRRRVERDGRTRTESKTSELFRHEVDLAIDASFPDNTDLKFDGYIPVPAAPTADGRELPGEVPGWVGTLVDVASALSTAQREKKWYVEARYDIPRLDLKDRHEISVNL